MASDPIFIIGTERSGSNLLRMILNAHSRILVPHPPHVVRYLAPLEARYGDLSQDANLRRLIRDVLHLVHVHIYPWEVDLDAEAILRAAEPRNLFGVYVATYDQYLAASGKRRWACKSTFMIDHTDAILARFPGARLIWLVRDPRDVAVSSRRSVFNPFHPYFTARLWARQQQTGLGLTRRLGANTLLKLHYEALVADPEATVKRVCAFIGEPFEDRMLRYFETPEARKGGHLSESWTNIRHPVLSQNAGKYKTQLSETEIRAVETVAGEAMQQLGYPLELPPATNEPPPWRVFGYRVLDLMGRTKVELRSLRRDRNRWRRFARGALLTYLVVRR